MALSLNGVELRLVSPRDPFWDHFIFSYINDLENGIKSNVKFFGDDTSLFSIVTNSILSASELNSDLEHIEK